MAAGNPTAATAKSPIALSRFFVFNSTLASVEGEEAKKILYYYPPDADLDSQIRYVGLCEAVIKFSKTFGPNKSCEAMHTQKTRQFLFEAEPDFWMIMVVSVPFVQKLKDNQAYAEYHGDDVQDNIYQAILRQAYNMFKFFMGPFSKVSNSSTQMSQLKQKLEHFYSRYLLTLKLNNADILDAFQGICFLPLDKHNFLKTQFFINQLEALFPQVSYVAFLYNEQLVWSGLEQNDMQIMYKYLTTSLFPAFMEAELQTRPSTPSRSHHPLSINCCHYGKFITGPQNIETSRMGKIPRVCVKTSSACEECHLIVYQALSATVCLLVDGQSKVGLDWYKKLDAFLGPNMTTLASEIDDHHGRSSGNVSESQFKYIYFNHMNLAQKSTVHGELKRTGSVTIASEVIKLLADMNADLARMQHCGEIILRTMNDCWVVGKFSDQREFYVIINQKNANLIEVNEEVKKLCSTHFSNIFILD